MRRRTLIKGMAALAPLLGANTSLAEPIAVEGFGAKSCRLITQDITGPFLVENVASRSDIRDSQPGVPLTLEFQVVATFTCQPVPGAIVSIWHSNAQGLYSGVENALLTQDGQPTGEVVDLTSESFLRGTQTSDASGMVRFQTIFPGWYFPRPAHLHLKVYPPSFSEVATTQLYFPSTVCDQVYATASYRDRGPNPNRSGPGNTSTVDASAAGDLWLDLQAGDEGYSASHQLGVTFYGDRFGKLSGFYRQS